MQELKLMGLLTTDVSAALLHTGRFVHTNYWISNKIEKLKLHSLCIFTVFLIVTIEYLLCVYKFIQVCNHRNSRLQVSTHLNNL